MRANVRALSSSRWHFGSLGINETPCRRAPGEDAQREKIFMLNSCCFMAHLWRHLKVNFVSDVYPKIPKEK